ncbi:MAG: ABC transporter permease [Myxococcales bacterium]|nr:MAG: ABC transporter permease [Myxococcales bacterium]
MRRAGYFLRKAVESMLRAPLLAFATLGMLAVIFLLFNGFSLLALNVSAMSERWIGQMRLTIFLADAVTPEEAHALALKLRERPEATGALYVTKDEAKARFLAGFPGNARILEGLPEAPLPASIELELEPEAMTLDMLTALAADVAREPGVEEAIFGRELFAKLSALVGLLHLIGVFLGFALMVAVVFLTANTIRLNLYARRDELEILQIVGATRWFIRWPFVIEGFLEALGGAVVSLCAAYLIFHAGGVPLAQALSGPFGEVTLRFFSVAQLLAILAAAAALGALGSAIALRRFWRAI